MEAFFMKHYRIAFTVLMVAIAGLAFYVGILEGKQSGSDAVILSCNEEVLSKLSIPVAALASGSTPTAPATSSVSAGTSSSASTGAFEGSKNGTKYYTPGCAGLSRIKPENIIWFQSAEDATLQGYTAASC